MAILVCPLSHVERLAAQWQPAHAISLLDPGYTFPVLPFIKVERHLRLSFHDAHDPGPGITLPATEHIESLVAFVRGCAPVDRLLIHCRAGIGRSTATAFIAACVQHPAVPEHEIAIALRRVAPLARPNETLVQIADAALGRGGQMSAAIADTGRDLGWVEVSEGVPFELTLTG